MFRQHGGVNSLRQLAQLLQRAPKLGLRLAHEGHCAGCVRADFGAHELQREADTEQALLHAVMQVALQPSALLVSRTDDARLRSAQLDELRAQLRLQPLVFERQASRRPSGGEKAPPLQQHRIVHERGDRGLRGTDRRYGATPSRFGKRDFPPCGIDIRPTLGQPERELERRVAECPRKSVANGARRRPLQLHDEAGDRTAPAVAPEQPERECDRNGRAAPPCDPEPRRVRPRVDGMAVHRDLNRELSDDEAR